MPEEAKKPETTIVDHTEAVRAERARVTEIRAIGAKWKQDKAADEAVSKGTSLEDFRAFVMEEEHKRQASMATIGLTQKETRQFSLIRAINAKISGDWNGAGFELECMRAQEKLTGRAARGILVPEDVLRDWSMGSMQLRTAANKTTDSQGGYLVGTQHMASEFVQALVANTVFMQTGVRVLPGLVSDIDIPTQLTTSTGYWVGEQTDVTESNLTFGQIAMAPKTVGAITRATRKMLLQSSPAIEAILRQDIIDELARKVDLAGFEGTGGTQPTGIANLGGDLNSVAFGGAPTWGKIVDMRTAVGADKVAMNGSACYVGSPEFVGKCQQTQKYSTTNGVSIMETADRLNGYPFRESTNITNTKLYFGVFSNVIIGMWGGLDILVDTITYAAQGGARLIALQDIDIGFRYDKAFCISTGMTVS